MAMPRSPKRDKAKELWLAHKGNITSVMLANILGIADSTIRKWKAQDKWDDELKKINKKNKGGQPGNKNAKGHGAPKRNKNAVTHGGYAKVYFDDLTAEEQKLINNMSDNVMDNMLIEYRRLIIQEQRIRKKINELKEKEPLNETYIDTITEMTVPKSKKEKTADAKEAQQDIEQQIYIESADCYVTTKRNSTEKLNMRITNTSTAHTRIIKLEELYEKTHGRIIKLLDSLKGYDIANKQIELEEKKIKLAYNRATGIFEDENEIIDNYED